MGAHWWALMSCAVFTLIGIIQLLYRKSANWTIWAIFGAAFGLLLVSSFLAWQDQYQENQAARDAGALPFLDVRVNMFQPNESDKKGTAIVYIEFQNIRDRLIEYHVDKFEVSLDSVQPVGSPTNYGGYVYATKQGAYGSPPIPVADVLKDTFSGAIDYSITYHAIGSKVEHHTRKSLTFMAYRSSKIVPVSFISEHED
jgi:hypothetical protein